MEGENKKQKSFANGLNFYKIFWIFYVGCFAGVVIETIWCKLKNGFFESRTALILEPLNPVYGIGAVLMTIIFVRLTKKNNFLSNTFLFIGCMVVGGVFEWLCSFFQELVFGTITWHYDSNMLGIYGRTSLIYCIFWGALGIAWVRIIYPLLSNNIEKIPNRIGKSLTFILLTFVCFDILFTSGAVIRREHRRNGTEAITKLDSFYDKYLDDEVLTLIYPHMRPVK